jgi:hypothetical protein
MSKNGEGISKIVVSTYINDNRSGQLNIARMSLIEALGRN